MKGIFKDKVEELYNGEMIHETEVYYLLHEGHAKLEQVGTYLKFTDTEKSFSRFVTVAPF